MYIIKNSCRLVATGKLRKDLILELRRNVMIGNYEGASAIFRTLNGYLLTTKSNRIAVAKNNAKAKFWTSVA